MANSIDTNRDLQETYQPHNATLVRFADEARMRGTGGVAWYGRQKEQVKARNRNWP